MAIIYTYPTKATLALADKVLISDSADGNKTKNATITSIKDAIDVVDSAASGSGISITGQGSGPYTGAITIANTGVLSFSNAFGTYITGTTNTSATGNASIGTLDLSAIDGVDTSNRFLSKDNVWSTVVGVVGPGTTNKIPKFATTTTLGDSIMAEQAAAGVFTASYIEISGNGGLSTQDLEINAALWDGSASKGTSGQLLSSTGTEISWIAPPAAGTQGQVQYNNNSDLAGSANMTFTDSGSTALFQVRNIVQVRGGGGNAGVLKLWSTDDATRVELQGPPSGGANYSLAMPASVGTANQVLKLPSTIPGSGASQLVWGDATGGVTYTFSTGLSESGGTVTLDAGLNNLTNVSFATGANSSLYVGQISPVLSGTPLGNVTLGGGAAKVATTAFDNTLVGSDAAALITEGSANVAIGSDVAATLTTGTNNVIIDDSANILGATLSSTTVIGQGASGAADSTVIGKGASASTNGTAIGSGASASGGGIAIGKDATAAANEIELNGITSSIVATTGNTAAGDLKITINGTVYYIALRTYAP